MNLSQYLKAEGSMTAAALARAIKVSNESQVRAWQHGYGNRLPSPENCVAIEVATAGAVRRQDLRPDDWHRIWPELVGSEAAQQAEQAAGV